MHKFLEAQLYMGLVVGGRSSGFPTRSDTNWAVQPQKMARGLRSRAVVLSVCENRGADQLCSNCAADLRLCFRICKMPVFS